MLNNKNYYLYFFLIWLLMSQSYSYSQTTTPESTIKSQLEIQNNIEPENLAHFGDLIDVDVIGSTEYDWRGRLNPEGFLDELDFVEGRIYGLCRNEEEIAADIAKGYAKLLRDPQVKVRIVDRTGRPNVFLYGAIRTPQRFSLQRPVRLNELLILAGGITEKASGEIQIIRPGNSSCQQTIKSQNTQGTQGQNIAAKLVKTTETEKFDIKIADLLKGSDEANPLILSGDIITILEAAPIYVIGGVVNPKQINARSQLTVSRAIDSAGGFAKNAEPKNISVFRRIGNQTNIIEVDFEKIKRDSTADIVLEKFDIVEVSQKGSDKRKFPPFIKIEGNLNGKFAELPLRVVD